MAEDLWTTYLIKPFGVSVLTPLLPSVSARPWWPRSILLLCSLKVLISSYSSEPSGICSHEDFQYGDSGLPRPGILLGKHQVFSVLNARVCNWECRIISSKRSKWGRSAFVQPHLGIVNSQHDPVLFFVKLGRYHYLLALLWASYKVNDSTYISHLAPDAGSAS